MSDVIEHEGIEWSKVEPDPFVTNQWVSEHGSIREIEQGDDPPVFDARRNGLELVDVCKTFEEAADAIVYGSAREMGPKGQPDRGTEL